MAGPAKQFDRDEALNSAMALFWAKGYEATSMQELVQAMGVNRASLYDTFGNKHAIYSAALDSYCASSTTAIAQMLNADGSALKSLQKFLTYLMTSEEGLGENGCFVNNAAVEFGLNDKEIADKVRQFWLNLEGLFKAVLDKAIEQKEISSSANTTEMASFINVIMQGLAVRSKSGMSEKEINAALELMLQALRV